MLISSLEQMEKIVEDHPNLRWDGWNVEYVEKNENAMFKLNGAFINNEWHTKSVFKNDGNSWNIPDNILRKGNVQI